MYYKEPSNFAKYKQERDGSTVLECDKGFITARALGDFWYIEELFVRKEYRKTNIASTMANDIANIGRELGFSQLLGSVDHEDKEKTRNTQVLLSYGMDIYKSDNQAIYFTKPIGE